MPSTQRITPSQTAYSFSVARSRWKWVAIMALMLLTLPAQAMVFIVNAPDGSIVDDGLCSISEAINAANSNSLVEDCGTGDLLPVDLIILENNVVLSENIYVHASQGNTGTPAITSDIVLAAEGYQISTTEALLPDVGRRMLWVSTGGNLTVKGIRFRDGYSEAGGAIYNEGTLSVDLSQFFSNTGNNTGGAILNSDSGTIKEITNTNFGDNDTGGVGGDIRNEGTITFIGNSTFSRSIGGAIHNTGRITTISQNTFTTHLFGVVSMGNDGTVGNFSRNILRGQEPDGSCQVQGNPAGTDNLLAEYTLYDPASCPFAGYVGAPTNIDDELRDNGCADPFADGSCILTYAILGGSSAIRQSTSGPIGGNDQRGFEVEGIRDIGAYERRPEDACRTPEQNVDGYEFVVNNDGELIDAIECAQLNGTANGGDTIRLADDIELDVVIDSAGGNTGTPTITTLLTIDGAGHKISRNGDLSCDLDSTQTSEEFRLLRVGSGSNVTLQNIELSGGCSDNLGGGAISNDGGTLTLLENSLLTGNQGLEGGAIRNAGTLSSVQNVTFSGNSAESGGAIFAASGTFSDLRNSTMSGNTATSGKSISVTISATISRMDNMIISGSASGHCAISGGLAGGTNNLVDGGNCGSGVVEAVTNFDAVLRSNNCSAPCLRTHALQPGSNALDGANGFATASDQRGFAADLTRDIGAFEAQRPYVTAPANISTEATGPTTSPGLGNATVSHTLQSLVATALPAGDFAVGTTSVIWSATDSHGFVDSATQSVTITDNTRPVVSAPGNITTEATGPTTPVALGVATASDLVDVTLTPTADNSGPFAVGAHTITWSAIDTAGNTGMATQTVTITDNTAPVVISPADISMEATGPTTTVVIGSAMVNDDVDIGLIATSNAPASFPLGITSITWSATDSSQNTGTATQTVTIADDTPPEMVLLGENPINLDVGDSYIEAGANATDLVDGDLTASISITGSINTNLPVSQTLTYSITDAAGNANNITRTVNVGTVRSFSGPLPSGNTGMLSFISSDEGCSFVSEPQFLDVSSAPFEPPPGMTLVDGMLSFVIENCTPGASVQVSMDYGQPLPAGVRHWKSARLWYELRSSTNGNTISFTLVDGGSGDEDSIPGSITDPSASGIWYVTPIPTLSYRMMGLMAGALLLVGFGGLRRRRLKV